MLVGRGDGGGEGVSRIWGRGRGEGGQGKGEGRFYICNNVATMLQFITEPRASSSLAF